MTNSFYEITWKIIDGDKFTGHYIHYNDLCDALRAWREHPSNPTDERLEFVTINVIQSKEA